MANYTIEDIERYRAEGKTWSDIGNLYGVSGDAPRKWLAANVGPSKAEISGLTAADNRWPDEEEVFERACREWEKTEIRLAREVDQYISFERGPVGIAFVADLHLGGKGVNYPRVFEEAEVIAQTPGLFAFAVGDLVDNFVIGKLMRERLNARLSIRDEWVLVRRWMHIAGGKLVGACSGNHENWFSLLTGISYFQEVLAQVNRDCLYDKDDIRAQVRVGGATWPMRVRHQWRGSSIYNSSHGIERAAKWDQDFRVGVGAHDHINGACRTFTIGGEQGMAVKAGTYKVDDSFARRRGFAKSGPSTAAVVIFDDDPPSMTGFTCLTAAARYLDALYTPD